MVKVKEAVQFEDNKNNTVSDAKNKLQWIQDHCAVKGFDKELNDIETSAAIAELNRIKYAGHDDWREPSRPELLTIVDLTKRNPAINPIFKNTKSSWYRTSTSVAGYPSYVWCVVFYSGSVYGNGKGYEYYVRPVRASQ
ncbi:MAG: Lcl C-terminal domain-containing protein [Candidatus Omnitrophota bacterium]